MLNLAVGGNKLVATISGDLDMYEARDFKNKVDEMLLANINVRDLVIDLSAVSFIDSTGLGAIIGRYKVMKLRGGRVMLVGASKSVYKILEMAGLKSIMGISLK